MKQDAKMRLAINFAVPNMIHMKFLKISIFSLLLFCQLASLAQPQTPSWVAKVGARKFTLSSKNYLVTNFGAKNDGITLSTVAIQKAINECSAKGGGTVSFLPGKYLTGSLFVKKNVNLKIGKGAKLCVYKECLNYIRVHKGK